MFPYDIFIHTSLYLTLICSILPSPSPWRCFSPSTNNGVGVTYRQQNSHDKCKDVLDQMKVKTQQQPKMWTAEKHIIEKHLQQETSVLETQEGAKIGVLSFHVKHHRPKRSQRIGAIKMRAEFMNKKIKNSRTWSQLAEKTRRTYTSHHKPHLRNRARGGKACQRLCVYQMSDLGVNRLPKGKHRIRSYQQWIFPKMWWKITSVFYTFP